MRPTPYALIAVFLLALSRTESAAEPIFASPPHVVADEDGRRIVLFLNEPVSGALTARVGSGYEIRVPRSVVAPAIQGQDFGADGWGNGGDTVKHLVLAAGPKGDTAIRIEPSAPVGGVDAHSVDDPPRLVIELLATAPTKTPVPTKTPGRSAAPVKSKAPAPTATKAAPRPTGTRAAPAPTATPGLEPIAIADARDAAEARASAATRTYDTAPSAEALARATVLTALALAEPPPPAARPAAPSVGELLGVKSPPPDAPAPKPAPADAHAEPAAPVPSSPVGANPAATDALAPKPAPIDAHAESAAPVPLSPVGANPAATDAPAPKPAAIDAHAKPAPPVAPTQPLALTAPSAPSAPLAPSPQASLGLTCLWRRFGGLALCVGDPKAAPYAGDHTIMAMVGALARGKLPEPEDTPAVATPALAFLQADVLFATRAAGGKLLPVVDAYRTALRQHPDFPDAWRARLNLALAYRAMEFLTELRTVAREAALDRTIGVVRGLAGDLAVVTGKLPIAAEEYRRAADVGGVGACFAARGRARLALAANDANTAAAEIGSLTALCPPEIAADAETIWIRGNLARAQQDFAAARTLLGEARKTLSTYDQGAVAADLGAVAEAAGDPKAARESYEPLLTGDHGARAARQATVRLAVLDGVGGDVPGGLKRLERLTPEAAGGARRSLVMQTARGALERGAPGAAIAAVHDAHVDPRELPLDDQLVVARAYREIGLGREAETLLAEAHMRAGAGAPDALFAERGTLAIARRDAIGSVGIADEWIRVRGRNAGALGLKARAAAIGGDGVAAHAAVAAATLEDPSVARLLALDVAELLRDRQPAAALVLAREAMDPGPAPPLPTGREAAGLALVGQLAEEAGDDDTALAAFTTLTARYGKEPIAADAAYRAARLAARRVPAGASAAYDEAARSKDPLARRIAGAAQKYEAIVKPLGGAPPAAPTGAPPARSAGKAAP